MKNKKAKQMMLNELFNSYFMPFMVHSIDEYHYPYITCWNKVLMREQTARLSRKTVSLTADQHKAIK